MLLQFASDLHLENPANRDYVINGGLRALGECLILAGDVALLSDLHAFDWFWDWCGQHYRQTWIVPGNHEFYGQAEASLSGDVLRLALRSNVEYLNNVSVEYEGVHIVCTTLWSAIKDPCQREIVQRQIADYRCIRKADRAVTIEEINGLHERSLAFLESSLNNVEPSKTVVVTHHVPIPELTPQRYRTSEVKAAFIADCRDLVLKWRPAYWIYGHSHVSDRRCCFETCFVSNQLGTVRSNKTLNFNSGAVLKI